MWGRRPISRAPSLPRPCGPQDSHFTEGVTSPPTNLEWNAMNISSKLKPPDIGCSWYRGRKLNRLPSAKADFLSRLT